MAKGYSLDALANVAYPCYQNILNVDLDTLWGRDNEGKYYQAGNAGATAANHYPTQEAGVLEVLVHNANGVEQTMQRYTTYSSGRMFWRTQASANSKTWSDWDEFAKMSLIYKQVYPVGAIYTCVNSVDPNTLFPGTTWAQITDGRSLRSSTNNTVGTASGNIGETGGADSVSIGTGNLPAHSHTIAHTHDAPQHTHSVPAHSHTMAHTHGVAPHTHSVPAHSHTMAHTHSVPAHGHTASASTSVTVASGGAHSHDLQMTGSADGTGSPPYPADGRPSHESTNTAGQAGGVQSGGAHSHSASASTSVTVNNAAAMTTGGSSAANTGTQAAMTTGGTGLTTGGSSSANTGTQAAMTTGNASALTTGGASVASSGNTGSGTALSIANTFRRVAVWQRTA